MRWADMDADMPHTDEQLLAYLDGQMEHEADYHAMEARLETDAALRERLQELVVSAEAVQLAYRAKLQEPVPARLIDAIWKAPWPAQTSQPPQPRRGDTSPQPANLWARVERWMALLVPGRMGAAALASVAWIAVGAVVATAVLREPGNYAGHTAEPDWTAAGSAVSDPALLTLLQGARSGAQVQLPRRELSVVASLQSPEGLWCREVTERSSGPELNEAHALLCQDPAGQWTVAHAVRQAITPNGYQTASSTAQADIDRFLRSSGEWRELTEQEEADLMRGTR